MKNQQIYDMTAAVSRPLKFFLFFSKKFTDFVDKSFSIMVYLHCKKRITGKRQNRGDAATQSYRGCESSQPVTDSADEDGRER